MATTVDTLLVRIESDMANLRRDLKQIEQRTGATGKAFQNLGRLMATALAGFGVAQVVNTIRTFEDLNATLKAVTGSAELASASFDLIRKFTATTTFQLEEVSGAFITLVNAGIAPTSDALKDIGNIAAARGKDIREVAKAVFNATTGDMEMLKQLGIVARVDGEKLNVTYKGVTETIDRSANSIVNYIRELSQAEFPTAIEERANTLSGAISNLGDNISEFFMAIGDAGFTSALTNFTKQLITILNNSRPLAEVIGKALATGLRALGAVLTIVTENLRGLTAAMIAFLAVSAVGRIAAVVSGFVALAKAMRAAHASGQLLNNMMKKSPWGVFAAGLAYLAAESGQLDEVMDIVAKKFGFAGDEAGKAATTIEDLDAIIAGIGANAGPNLTPFTKAITKAKEELEELKMEAAGQGDLAKVYADLGVKQVEGGLVFPEGSAEKIEELKEIYAEIAKVQKQIDSKEIARGFMDEKTQVEELETVYQALSDQLGNTAFNQDALKEAMSRVQREIELQDPMMQSLVQTFEQAGDRIANSLAEAFANGEFSLKSFGNIVKDSIQQIIANFLKLQLINPILNSLFRIGGTAFALPTAQGSAGGGMMHPSQPRLVGERGPELFVPHSAGTLKNNANTRGAMGGGSSIIINQSVNFATGIQSTVRAEVMNMMPQIQGITLQAVKEAKQRGGSFANAFGG